MCEKIGAPCNHMERRSMRKTTGKPRVLAVVPRPEPATSQEPQLNRARTRRAELPEIVSTSEAATVLARRPQTLRRWACFESGPIQPIRIHGRLGWLVSDLQSLLSGRQP